MTSMTNAETGVGGPPSFLTMLEQQNRQAAGNGHLKPNNTASALHHNFFHNRPNSLGDDDYFSQNHQSGLSGRHHREMHHGNLPVMTRRRPSNLQIDQVVAPPSHRVTIPKPRVMSP